MIARRNIATTFVAFANVILLIAIGWNLALASEPDKACVTLLLPGMQFDLDDPSLSFGSPHENSDGEFRWSGLIGSLDSANHPFGGVIRPDGASLALPKCLDTKGARVHPREAKLFVLDYSSSATVDGLAYKTLELAACIEELREYTGCEKVRLVAFSAGGLVARAYLQSALPKVAYEGDVDRLITIATPHLGSEKAEHFGDFLGTRATSIKPSSDLIQRLNDDLELPADVKYASIVVRGMRIGSSGLHDQHEDLFQKFVDQSLIAKLPLDYQKGTDQVVNVWSQNLAVTRCARDYERANDKPVQYALARVSDPSPSDWVPFDTCVHEVAANDDSVVELVKSLLCDRNQCWSGLSGTEKVRSLHRQASNCAFGIIEDAMATKHKCSEVYYTNVSQVRHEGNDGDRHKFSFVGEAKSKWRSPPRIRSSATFEGTMELEIDKFGRVTDCRFSVAKK